MIAILPRPISAQREHVAATACWAAGARLLALTAAKEHEEQPAFEAIRGAPENSARADVTGGESQRDSASCGNPGIVNVGEGRIVERREHAVESGLREIPR